MLDTPDLPPRVLSIQVVIRFLLRMAILSVAAALASGGFAQALAGLLVLAAIYCLVIGAIRREAPFDPMLTHFDEAAAYAAAAVVASWAA